AAAQVGAGVSAGTVVGLLLWAEARGPAFSELLSRLKAWYVANHEAVVEEAPDSFGRLAVQSPTLMAELMMGYTTRTKRQREIPVPCIGGVVTRRLPPGSGAGCGGGATQTLVAGGGELRPLLGAGGRSGLELGPPLQLCGESAATAAARRPTEGTPVRHPYVPHAALCFPVWDPFSSAVYLMEGTTAVLRLDCDDTVTVVTGAVGEEVEEGVDGPGSAARFVKLWALASDGAGALYAVDTGGGIRKLQLPAEWRHAAAGARGSQPSGGGTAAPGAAAATGQQAAPVQMSTLLCGTGRVKASCLFFAPSVAGGSGSGSLAFARRGRSPTLYRLPLDAPNAQPVLLAGPAALTGRADGSPVSCISGLVVDGSGAMLVAVSVKDVAAAGGEDGPPAAYATVFRRVPRDGAISSIGMRLTGIWGSPAILPNGYLALCGTEGALTVLDLGLQLPTGHAANPTPADAYDDCAGDPPPRTLPADLAALLDQQPDDTADVAILVGGRTFHAHRLILSARCDYFRQLLGSNFAEGSARQLNLPDADPDAFAVVLRFVYTGTAANIPAAQAQAVAELADRLLLPELCRMAAAQVGAGVSAGTVVGLLLWAEARGPAFSELLSRLKAWYVANHEAVVEEAPDSFGRLAVQSPTLMAELMMGYTTRTKRQRLVLTARATLHAVHCRTHGAFTEAPPLTALYRSLPESEIPVPFIGGVVTRRLPPGRGCGGGSTQTLVVCGGELRPLLGAEGRDDTADVAILVGGRTFHAHRLILSARCDYFRQLLGSNFAEGSARQLNLPDADPDAFAVVLRFVYTGTAANIPAAQAQAVAELADRLLLPELCRMAAAQVGAGVSAGTVVGLLLWAEARGPAFSELLSRLKAWYVANHEAVVEEAPDSFGRLAVQSPTLMAELMMGYTTRTKRQRLVLTARATLHAVHCRTHGAFTEAPPLTALYRSLPESEIPVPFIGGVVTRRLPPGRGCGGGSTQTLVVCGGELRPLLGAEGRGGLELGPTLQLYEESAATAAARRPTEGAPARRRYVQNAGLNSPEWDPFSSAVYLMEGSSAVLRLDCDDTVTVVAGAVGEEVEVGIDGPGGDARFMKLLWALASDGAGALYAVELGGGIRKLQLPPEWRHAAAGVRGAQLGGSGTAAPGAAAAAGQQTAAVQVSTLLFETLRGDASRVTFTPSATSGSGGGSLVFSQAVPPALYRLPLDAPNAQPLLLAGPAALTGRADCIPGSINSGLVVDGSGAMLVAVSVKDVAAAGGEDDRFAGRATVFRRVARDGAVSSIGMRLTGIWGSPAILPNGYLALCGTEGALTVLDLGLQLPPGHAANPTAADADDYAGGPPPRTLPADLAALLDQQPDDTADVAVLVGGRTFHAHRLILSARCDYFRQLLRGSFAEGSARQLSLPDADPDVFAVVLRFVYTGTAADIPAAQAQAVAELADRLLLPELCRLAAAQVGAGVSAGTVVGLLLWAEARGPAFSELLSRLKAWYVANHEAVAEEAPDSFGRLAVQSPTLMGELALGCTLRTKRQRLA
ncbi:ARM REPEAT PROTEIN INTERACTING WITH ABF2, partial [Tetrabaena socialis]